jgi:arginase family enzyme
LITDLGWRLELFPDFSEQFLKDPQRPNSSINAKNCSAVGENLRAVDAQMQEVAKSDNFVLIVGGDHSISIGTVPALARARGGTIGVVWVNVTPLFSTPPKKSYLIA